MKLPHGLTEEYFLETFDKVANKLTQKFSFGFRDRNDIYQEAFILAIECLKYWDKKRPLANFLYIHTRNRLCNFKRKHYVRIEPPCTRCPIKAFLPPDGCKAFDDRMDCELYEKWYNRNIIKRNLAHTLEYNQVKQNDDNEKNMKYSSNTEEIIDKKEIFDLIDKYLPINLRKHYLIMRAGGKVSKKDELIVQEEIIKILKENGYKL